MKKEERENGKERQKRNYSPHYNTFSHFRSGRAGGGVRSVVVRDYHKHRRGGSRIKSGGSEARNFTWSCDRSTRTNDYKLCACAYNTRVVVCNI